MLVFEGHVPFVHARVATNNLTAQAARLNLRMQKEIELLLSDPPAGVSLNLSEHESAMSSLSSIDTSMFSSFLLFTP